MPVPSEQASATCASCGAALVADQRYCLTCGHPCSPVRLAFLDALQAEPSRRSDPQLGAIEASYAVIPPQQGAAGWLRRNSGLLALLSVLLMCLIAGLLVGHWVSQGNKTPSKQVVEVKGLSVASVAPAAATPGATSTTSTPPTSSTASNTKAEAEEAQAEKKETKAEKAPPPPPVKVAPTKLKKITNTTGKQHEEEINSLGAQPIETGH